MKANKNKLAYIGVKPGTKASNSRDSDSWFTPQIYTEMVHDVLGNIDLDPFSSKTANKHVNAKRYFDINDNALKQEWFSDQGRVFMNPPYGRKIIDAAINTFLINWNNDSITQAIVLVNNATETKWFQSLLANADSLCLPNSRIAFENDDGKHMSGNTRGQIFLYFGHNVNKFEKTFSSIGAILIPYTNN